jgi:hypothetical protein
MQIRKYFEFSNNENAIAERNMERNQYMTWAWLIYCNPSTQKDEAGGL